MKPPPPLPPSLLHIHTDSNPTLKKPSIIVNFTISSQVRPK